MTFTRFNAAAVTVAAGLLALAAPHAFPQGDESDSATAATISARCDTWASPQRSRASVDGAGLPDGQYTAHLTSGAHAADAPAQAASAGAVQFDFDSNKKEIAAGATAIAPGFIVHDKVTGQIVDAGGNVVLVKTKTCKAH